MRRRSGEDSLRDELWNTYYRLGELIVLNLLWVVASLPVVTAIPALGALFAATNHMAHTGSANWRHFADGFRRHFWLSWRWGLVNAVALGVIGVAWWFYGRVETGWAEAVRWLVRGLLVAWVELQLFTFPLLLEQADQRQRTALRNSAVLFIRWPGIALSASVQIALIALASVLVLPPLWIVISASLCAWIANRAVVRAVQRMKATAAPE